MKVLDHCDHVMKFWCSQSSDTSPIWCLFLS